MIIDGHILQDFVVALLTHPADVVGRGVGGGSAPLSSWLLGEPTTLTFSGRDSFVVLLR